MNSSLLSFCLLLTQGLLISSYVRPDETEEFLYCLNGYVEPREAKELVGDLNGQYVFPRNVDMDLVSTFKDKSKSVDDNTDEHNKPLCDCIDRIMGYLNERTGCNFHVPTVYFLFEQCISQCLHQDYESTQKFLSKETIGMSLKDVFKEKCVNVFFTTFNVSETERFNIQIPIETHYFSDVFEKTLSLLLVLYMDNAKIQRKQLNYEALCEISLKDRSPVSLYLKSKFPARIELPAIIKTNYRALGQAICRDEDDVDQCNNDAVESFETLLTTVSNKAQKVSVILKLFDKAEKKLKNFYRARKAAEYYRLSTQTTYLVNEDFTFFQDCKDRFLKKINVTSYTDFLDSLKRESRIVGELIKMWHKTLSVYYEVEIRKNNVSQRDICNMIKGTRFNDAVESMLKFRSFYFTKTYEPSHLKALVGYTYYTGKALDI